MKIIIVEDEKEILEFLSSQFAEGGFEVRSCSSGENILQQFEEFGPDIVLLDQLMPGKSGRELVREIRSQLKYAEIPIMMLTGLDAESDKLIAFDGGVDDYITKPFSVKEVIARAHALLRRSNRAHLANQKKIEVKDLLVDLNTHKVFYKNAEVPLTLTEFKILCELLRQSGQVLTRDRLREKALGNLNVTDRTIDVHMASLRKKLSDLGDQIETVRGVGYRLAL